MTEGAIKKPARGELLSAVILNDTPAVADLLQRGACVWETSDGHSVLGCASWLGYKEIVRLLIENRADVNDRGSEGLTPLMLAASADHVEVVALLLDHGASINKQADYGVTALMKAARPTGGLDVMRLLVERGAKTDLQGPCRQTVYDIARSHSREDMLQFLRNTARLREQHTIVAGKQDRLKRLSVKKPSFIRGVKP